MIGGMGRCASVSLLVTCLRTDFLTLCWVQLCAYTLADVQKYCSRTELTYMWISVTSARGVLVFLNS